MREPCPPLPAPAHILHSYSTRRAGTVAVDPLAGNSSPLHRSHRFFASPPPKVATAKDDSSAATVEADRGKGFFRKIFHNINHYTKKGSVVPERPVPNLLFCASPSTNGDNNDVDDDNGNNDNGNDNDNDGYDLGRYNADGYDGDYYDGDYDPLDVPTNEIFFFSSKDKLSVVISAEELKSGEYVGERVLPNGDIYVGTWQGCLPEGTGKYLWLDGCMYEGEWRNGKKSGRGRMSWPRGATYEGDFLGGHMHGPFGTYLGNDGSSYRGSWKLNQKHGPGKQKYANGDEYEGLWKSGLRDGHGNYTWKNGSKYVGDWRGGHMSGRGVLTWPSGEQYDGQWLDGNYHGHAVFTWGDGSKYKGTWSKGLKDGKGMFYPADHRLLLTMHVDNNNDDDDNPSVAPRFLCNQSSESECQRSSDGTYVEKILLGEIPSDIKSRHGRSFAPDNFWDPEDLDGRKTSSSAGELAAEFDNRSCTAEREYVQGVLISESVKSPEPPLRRHQIAQEGQKEVKRSGESIVKGHRSYELMLNLQLGIRYTVGKITPKRKRDLRSSDFGPRARLSIAFPREGSQITPPHQSVDFRWKDYCPLVFRQLRELFKIDAGDYMLSICGTQGLREFSSPGKSGSVFYLSHDDRFMIKTMRKSEVKVLLRMLPSYYNHVHLHKNTLITKFFGLHRIKSAGGQKVRLVVMGNVLCTELRIHRRFDLKGSSQGRSTDKVEIDETTTLKDLDLDFVFHLESSWRDALLEQIARDCQFLEVESIMDYSLLLGLHFQPPKCLPFVSSSSDPHARNGILDHALGDPISCGMPPFDKGFGENVSDSLVHKKEKDCLMPGSHIRGSPLHVPLLSGNSRLPVRLGSSMPARAAHRPCRMVDEVVADEDIFGDVYDVVLYFGIIDVLQEYDMGKKLEHAYKSMQFDSHSISAVDPSQYSKRIQDFIRQVFPETV